MEPVLPKPPFPLAARTGGYDGSAEFWDQWTHVGSFQARVIKSYLPSHWAQERRVILDFGCGTGRTLRHLVNESVNWEIWGCDIDEPSISWLLENLSPPFRFFLVSEEPRIPRPDGAFDFVYAMSVFTHIVDGWSGWFSEVHRVLKPGGLALISILGRGMIQEFGEEAWDPDRIGMNALRAGNDWDSGGPIVFHSEWWVRAHWGRAFEVLRFDDHDEGHGLVLLKRREGTVAPEELDRPELNDQREVTALLHNVEQLHREDRRVRQVVRSLESALEACRKECNERARPRLRRRIAGRMITKRFVSGVKARMMARPGRIHNP